MRLTRKLTAAILAGILVVMVVAAIVRVRRETNLFEADMARDHRFVGHAIRGAVESLWATEGAQRAMLLVHTAHGRNPAVNLRIVSLDRSAPPAQQPVLRPELLADLRRDRDVELTRDDRYFTYVLLRLPEPGAWALEVSEGLDEQKRYVLSSVLHNALALCAILLVCAALAIALGYWFVGRPMLRLTEKARRVGAGDLSGPLVLEQHDELSEFANEMNAMCLRLDEAQRAVESATAARIDAIEQLRHGDRLRTVGQIASGIAHEIGTPLNVVLGRARMIAAGDCAPDEAVDHANSIADQARRMTTLIRQLLDFARPRGPQLERADLRAVTQAATEMLAPLAERRGVRIVVPTAGDRVPATIDPTQMQQVITNVVMNAIQAMPAGGTLTIELGERDARPPLDLGVLALRVYFVRVKDEGVGMSPEHRARVFEPFFTTKPVGEGTGLGLSVAFEIVRDHGGWIDVDSKPGTGSAFTIYIPADDGNADRNA